MDELLALLPQELNEEAFRLCSQLLYEAGVEPLPLLIPFFRHPNLEVRIQAVYLAGKSADKRLLRKHKTNRITSAPISRCGWKNSPLPH
ncbi:hypothetical protein [Paenibacillus lautus]|uniref:hypothetical protein n=1 Tax=Paenibacillus lautus TaxID=1401 RepID=UPI002DBD29FA|nr:hypothetical protein [Paenibacillus lautus]MEC0258020.1 hypothetical protein [Paenibacillus lautus]